MAIHDRETSNLEGQRLASVNGIEVLWRSEGN
jgi:hypothetical protein